MKSRLHTGLISAILLAAANGHADISINAQPTDQSVSLGASATFRVSATTTDPPLRYQWRLATVGLPLATNSSLTLNNIQVTNAGDYDAVLTDAAGTVVTSQVAYLEVDPTFTKITTGRIVTDSGSWIGCAWGDYDGDGLPDLFVTGSTASGVLLNALYHNDGKGTFTRVTTVAPVTEYGNWICCAWADYDNDGHLDLLLTRSDTIGFPSQITLYHNNGDGSFQHMPAATFHGPADPGGAITPCAAWADYDRDGFLDLYVTRTSGGSDWLLHNNGDGTFTRDLTTIPPDNQLALGSTWVDYNNDGWPDLVVGNSPNYLYQNNGNGTFTRILSGSIATQSFSACLWGDYDNDGYLDALSADANGQLAIFHNNGDGTFTLQTSQQVGNIVSEVGNNWIDANWGDYDNDGFVDLFITGSAYPGRPTAPNFLYHNNGDGSFTRVLSGSLANDLGNGTGCVWGDYDNDGFLDLFVARGALSGGGEANLLYRNNGNTNAWVKVRLTGTASNRSAIGAKVRVRATIRGRTMWQMREINTGGDGNLCGALLEAHFGLGDATNIDEMRIEWPSGIVQTLTNVAPRRSLTVMEHQAFGTNISPPICTGVSRTTDGGVKLSATGDTGLLYVLEGSTNLVNWTKLGVRSNATGVVEFTDARAPSYPLRFYRVSIP